MSGQALEQVVQGGRGVSVHGHIRNTTGHCPGQPAVDERALSRGLDLVISRGAFQTQQFCDFATLLKRTQLFGVI